MNKKVIIQLIETALSYNFPLIKDKIEIVSYENTFVNDTILILISILIKPAFVINPENDELVIEFSSRDSKIVKTSISDSLGIVHYEFDCKYNHIHLEFMENHISPHLILAFKKMCK